MPTSKSSSVVLGIDPGFKRIGYGVVRQDGTRFSCLAAGMVRTPYEKDATPRQLSNALGILFTQWHPNLFAIEKVYFGQNKTSVLAVSEIRGMLLLLAQTRDVPIVELTPLEVKSIVCGYGRADKAAVRKIITATFASAKDIKSRDAIDGIAIALAGWYKQKQQDRIARAAHR